MTDSRRVGAFFAAFFAAAAVTSAYLPLWLSDRGLSASEIGQVLGLASLLRVFAVPGWGWAADRLGRLRLVLGIAALCATIGALLLPMASGFGPVLAVIALQGVSAAALTPLSDTLALALVRAGRIEYGRTRALGSIAYMAATAGAGLLLQRLGTAVVPTVLAAGYGLATCLTVLLPKAERAPAPPGSAAAASVLGQPAFRLTLLATALIQGAHAAYYSFAPLHWRAAGIPDATIGLLIAEGLVAEVALFIWGRSLVERLGPARLTALAAGASVLRWTATAFITDVPALAAVQLLHAATFAFQHLSAMQVLRALPAARAGTAQAVLAAFGFSAPTALLTWVSGGLYAEIGGQTFLAMAAVGGTALLLVPRLNQAARAISRST